MSYIDSCFLFQEKIMRVPYGVNKDYFKYSLFLVFCNRITTSAVSAAALVVSKYHLCMLHEKIYCGFLCSINILDWRHVRHMLVSDIDTTLTNVITFNNSIFSNYYRYGVNVSLSVSVLVLYRRFPYELQFYRVWNCNYSIFLPALCLLSQNFPQIYHLQSFL